MFDLIIQILHFLHQHNKVIKTLQQFNRAIIIIKIFFADKKSFIISSSNIHFDLKNK